MKFNGIQLTAIIKSAQAMIAADGRVDDAEKALLSGEIANFGISEQSFKDFFALAMEMEPGTMIAVLSGMSKSQKKYVSGFLASLMIADHDINDAEVKIWQLISTFMECPKMSVEEAVSYWTRN